MTTEHMGQIAVKYVVTVIKDIHVTRRRGRVLRDVNLDMMGCTATKVRYLLTSIPVLFHIELNKTFGTIFKYLCTSIYLRFT